MYTNQVNVIVLLTFVHCSYVTKLLVRFTLYQIKVSILGIFYFECIKQELHISSPHATILVSVFVAAEMKQMLKKSETKNHDPQIIAAILTLVYISN